MTSWVEVLVRMVDGPDLPVRGVIVSANGSASPGSGTGWVSVAGAAPPQFTGTSATPGESTHRRVWRQGAKVRIERDDGSPILLCDGTTSWRFARDNPVPITAPGDAVRYAGNGTHLITRRPANDFAGNDFTRPTGPVRDATFLGRPVWEFELAAPPRKIGPLLQRVDVETGLVLHQRAADGSVDEWTEFEIGPIDDALFTWSGPSQTAEEEHRQVIARGDEERARRRQWFRDNVTDVPLRARIEVDLSVDYVHTFDDNGAFEASIGQRFLSGSLARRPRSAEPWELRWSGVVHRWSTTRFDWALSLHDSVVTPESLRELQSQLHPGENPG